VVILLLVILFYVTVYVENRITSYVHKNRIMALTSLVNPPRPRSESRANPGWNRHFLFCVFALSHLLCPVGGEGALVDQRDDVVFRFPA
jgi:hypothetical protein